MLLNLRRPSAGSIAYSGQSALPTKIQPITRTSHAAFLGNSRIASQPSGQAAHKAVTQCVDVDDNNEDFLPEL